MQKMQSFDSFNQVALRFWRIAAIISLIMAVAYISVAPQVSNDFWLQAKIGELIVTNHEIPKTVLFPFNEAKDQLFNAHEWFPSVLFYWFLLIHGESGLPLLMGFLGLLLFGVMGVLAYTRSNGNLPLALFLGFLAVAVENQRHFLRPELLSLLILGVYWWLLEKARETSSALHWISAWLMIVLWANTHGSFILAPIISAIYAVGGFVDARLHRATAAIPNGNHGSFLIFTLLALAATAVNPVGVDLLKFVVDFGNEDQTKLLVGEWMPTFDPVWRNNRGFWIGMMCAIGTILLTLFNWRKVSIADALLLLFFLILAAQAIRFLVYLGIVAAYVLPAVLSRSPQDASRQKKGYVALVCIGMLVLGLSMKFGNAYGAFPHKAPEINQSLSGPMKLQLSDTTLQGNVLNSYELGAELVFRAYPRLRPSIDSRIDSYGSYWVLLQRRLFVDDQMLRAYVLHYDVRYMLLTHNDFLALQKLESWSQKLWGVRALDKHTALLQRSDIPLN